jgi:hypothetical protein
MRVGNSWQGSLIKFAAEVAAEFKFKIVRHPSYSMD